MNILILGVDFRGLLGIEILLIKYGLNILYRVCEMLVIVCIILYIYIKKGFNMIFRL